MENFRTIGGTPIRTKYLFSDPEGDILLSLSDLARPFLLSPTIAHPFLTLEDYFRALEEFLLQDRGEMFLNVLKERFIKDGTRRPDLPLELMIRSEKHGALYHIASAEFFFKDRPPVKLAITSALSGPGKDALVREFEILRSLCGKISPAFLPEPFFLGKILAGQEEGRKESLVMFAGEWLTDYHEWHFSRSPKGEGLGVCLWDSRKGNTFLARKQVREIFRQAAMILTLYYDLWNFSQIYPWHHAAGDFVVQDLNGHISVKLVTARRYEPLTTLPVDDPASPTLALISFFLNLTLRMRLDKLDGVGEAVWAEDFVVAAAIKGFFEALRIRETKGQYGPEDLLELLTSFTREELETLYVPLLDIYRQEDPDDFRVIRKNLSSHCNALFLCLETLSKP